MPYQETANCPSRIEFYQNGLMADIKRVLSWMKQSNLSLPLNCPHGMYLKKFGYDSVAERTVAESVIESFHLGECAVLMAETGEFRPTEGVLIQGKTSNIMAVLVDSRHYPWEPVTTRNYLREVLVEVFCFKTWVTTNGIKIGGCDFTLENLISSKHSIIHFGDIPKDRPSRRPFDYGL